MHPEYRNARIEYVKWLHEGGLTIPEIAARLGCAVSTAGRTLHCWPIVTRREEFERNVKLARRMRAAGIGTGQIAAILERSPATVREYLKASALTAPDRWRRHDQRRKAANGA
jgi:DNA-binding CsgD family transcriptional regulator